MTPLEAQLKEENDLLRTQNEALLSRLNTLIESFEAFKAQKEKEHQLMEERANLLEERVKILLKQLYGPSSEKTKKQLDGQIVMEEVTRLFNEAEVFEEKAVEGLETEEAGGGSPQARKTKKGHRLTDIFSNLPEKEVLYRIPEDERICVDCGHELKVVGIRHNRYEIEYIPSRVNLLNIKQETCTCPSCSKEKAETVFVEPKVPEPVLQHSYASPSAIAHVMYQKYVQGLPLYRQVKDWESWGVSLSRGTLSSWVVKATHEWFFPLLDELKRSLDQEAVLHADETPVQVLNEEGRKNEAKSYMWVLSSAPYSTQPVRYFEYAPSRGQQVPERLLAGYRGYLVTDDYAGYNSLRDLRRCSCWAHYPRRIVIRGDLEKAV